MASVGCFVLSLYQIEKKVNKFDISSLKKIIF